jgi:SNF2 family DNA or RNA helicase
VQTETHPYLQRLRQRTDLKLKPLHHLKKTFHHYDGEEQELRVRYYQVQGAMHLLAMTRFVLGDDCGIGKTLQALTALCCLWEKDPSIKAVILTTKSSVPEWRDEFVKFTSGIKVFRVPDLAALAPKKRPSLTAKRRTFFKKLFGEDYFDALKAPEPKVREGDKGKKPDLLELLEASAMSPREIAKKKVELSGEEKKEERKRKKEEKDRKTFLDSICQLWLVAKDVDDKGLRSLVEDVGKRLARGAPVSTESEQKLSEALKEHRVVKIPASDRRAEVYREFTKSEGPAAIVMNYRKAVIDYDAVRPMIDDAVLVFDECTAFKNHRSDVHKACRHLADVSSRAWGMTATLIQNRLMEGFGVYRVIKPDLFKTVSGFHGRYCIVQMQRVKGNRKIPLVVGHSKAQIEDFRATIDPYFLGRAKHEVASELPAVITKIIRVGLSKSQRALYTEALGEILEVIKAGEAEYKEMDELTRVTYCQEIVDHPGLIGHEGTSEKLDRLMDLVSEGDFAEHQIVVFSRFKSMINIIERELARKKVSSVRITGDENERQRKTAMSKFRKANSDVRIALITTAGSMAINLQTAAAFIFFDTPWSAGDWIQAFGRIDRIGSKHSSIYCVHLVAKDTIDDRVIARIRAKRRLIEAALGKIVLRDKDGDFQVSAENDIKELFQDLVKDAKRLRRR